jgi:hypothetical protein
VYLVCVYMPFDLCVMFIMFFVFILFPCHKSRESVKIGPHPRGQPLSYGIRAKNPIIWYQQLLVATDLLLFVISTINLENTKNSPKIASNFDL